jgi:hypothetical protein
MQDDRHFREVRRSYECISIAVSRGGFPDLCLSPGLGPPWPRNMLCGNRLHLTCLKKIYTHHVTLALPSDRALSHALPPDRALPFSAYMTPYRSAASDRANEAMHLYQSFSSPASMTSSPTDSFAGPVKIHSFVQSSYSD